MLSPMRVSLTVLLTTILAVPLLAADPPQVQKAWDILDAGVKEKSFNKRHDAVLAMGLLAGNSKAVATAENALIDNAPEVREAGATSLGELRSSSSIPKLEVALKDKDITVVLASAHSLYLLKDKQAFDIYYEILVGEHKATPGLIEGQEQMFRDKRNLQNLPLRMESSSTPLRASDGGFLRPSIQIMSRRCGRQPRKS